MKKKSVIWSWLVSYIIVLMIPLVTVFVNYNVNQKTICQGLMDANELICQNLKNSIGDYLMQEEKACNWIFSNEKMWNISRNKEKSAFFYYESMELCQQIANYCLHNDDLRCLVFFTGTDYIITEGTGNDSMFYYNMLKHTFSEVEEYDVWKEKIGADYKKQFFVSKWLGYDSEDECLSYANSFYTAGSKVNVIVSIPLKCIEQQITHLKDDMYLIIGLGKEYIAFDNKGYTMLPDFASIGDDGELILAGEDILNQVETTGEIFDRYWLISTDRQMEADLVYTRKSFAISLTITIVFGLSGIVILLFQNYQPVRKLSREVCDATEAANEFEGLEQIFTKLKVEKQFTQEVLKRQQNDLQASWLLAVMKGRVSGLQEEERRKSFEEHLEEHLKGGIGLVGFMLPLADPENIEHDELLFFVVNNVFEELVPQETIYHIEDGRYVFYLFDIPEERRENWQQNVLACAEYLCNLIRDKWNIDLIGVVSEPAENMDSLKFLYKNVMSVLEYQDMIGSGGAVTVQMAAEYPDLEGLRKIIEVDINKALKDGKREEADAMIDRVFVEGKGHTLVTMQFYSSEIVKVVLECFDDCASNLQKRIELLGYMNRIIQAPAVAEMKKVLKELVQVYFNEITEYAKYEGSSIVNKIQEYVEENYADPSLNVNAIADTLQRNQKYISRVFKAETGVGLLTYINNFRIYKAQMLMQEKDGTLEEIAIRVGFNNVRTFRRAWARANGDLPGSYREG